MAAGACLRPLGAACLYVLWTPNLRVGWFGKWLCGFGGAIEAVASAGNAMVAVPACLVVQVAAAENVVRMQMPSAQLGR